MVDTENFVLKNVVKMALVAEIRGSWKADTNGRQATDYAHGRGRRYAVESIAMQVGLDSHELYREAARREAQFQDAYQAATGHEYEPAF